MNRLLTAAFAILVMMVPAGYVASTPATDTQANPALRGATHLDAHVGYYEQHLISLGIARARR